MQRCLQSIWKNVDDMKVLPVLAKVRPTAKECVNEYPILKYLKNGFLCSKVPLLLKHHKIHTFSLYFVLLPMKRELGTHKTVNLLFSHSY
jgi:hypothetical protein